jgi:hypothetical protein
MVISMVAFAGCTVAGVVAGDTRYVNPEDRIYYCGAKGYSAVSIPAGLDGMTPRIWLVRAPRDGRGEGEVGSLDLTADADELVCGERTVFIRTGKAVASVDVAAEQLAVTPFTGAALPRKDRLRHARVKLGRAYGTPESSVVVAYAEGRGSPPVNDGTSIRVLLLMSGSKQHIVFANHVEKITLD